uniref:PD-(D/E)XK nuclease domain-containing protein n=1 Tax=Prevotella sp. TaxID=59823 RepID=UPI004029F35C
MDVIIQTPNYIYIIECKLDGSAEETLQQIEAKNYAAPFAMDKLQKNYIYIEKYSDGWVNKVMY